MPTIGSVALATFAGLCAALALSASTGSGSDTNAVRAAPAPVLQADAGPSRSPHAGAEPRWRWPLRPRPRVDAHFEAPRSRWGPGHRGLDLVGAHHAEVTAVADGVVSHRGMVAGRPTVSVTHPDGTRSTYEPVQSSLSPGDRIETGAVLGRLVEGPDHCGGSTCLHLGALRGRDYLDPLPFFGDPTVILLPTGAG